MADLSQSNGERAPGIAYLFSRYPVPSQTFCDWEMLAHEAAGFPLLVASLNPPPSPFRHDHFGRLEAEIAYPPLGGVPSDFEVPEQMAEFAQGFADRYGDRFRPEQRARNAAHFGSILKARGIGHCHIHFANQATVTALMMKSLGLTYSFTAHGQDFTTDLGDDGLVAELAAGAEFVIGVSDSACKLLKQMCPGSEDKIHRIYNGVDLDRFPTANPARDGRLEIVSVGRLIEFKGFGTLIEACRLLRDRGVDIHCTIVGDGPLHAGLEAQITSHGLGDNVVLAGLQPQDEIRALLERAHLFALGSLVDSKGAMDTLPTVITEAMACSLPVVSTRLAGIPEMVDEGKTGLLVDPGDAAALAEVVGALAGDPARRQSLGRAGRARAEQLFALETCAAQLRARLEPLASSQPAPQKLYLHRSADGSLADEIAGFGDAVTVVNLRTDLPDASIAEGEWLADADARARVEDLRTSLPKKFHDAAFYQSARDAVASSRMVKARGIRVVHAARADCALLAWMVAGLCDGCVWTAGIEPDPAVPRPLLRVLLDDCAAASVGDPLLAKELAGDSRFADVLGLAPPAKSQKRIGPIKITRTAEEQAFEPKQAEQWLRRMEEVADV